MRVTNFMAASVLTAAALSRAGAQEPRRLAEAETIPVELAAALANTGGFGGEPQILVGSMPEWAASRLFVPQSARLLGSAFLGTTVVAVLTIPGEPDSALVTLRNQLLQQGWKNPPPPPVYTGGGFRPAQNPVTPSAVSISRQPLCGDTQLLTIAATRRRMGGTDVTYRLLSTSGYSPCHPQAFPAQNYRSPFPTLYNPPNAAEGFTMGTQCQSNYSGNGTGTVIRSSMSAEALIDHYGRQIVDSGWTSVAGEILGRTWTKKDSTGAPVELTLTVTPTGKDGSCQRLDLQLKTFPKP